MTEAPYHATPAFRCSAPSRTFWSEQQARQYAQEAADSFHISYAVWSSLEGRLRLLARFAAAPARA